MSSDQIKYIKKSIRTAENNIDILDFQKHNSKGKQALTLVYQQLKWILYRNVLIASLDAPEAELQSLRKLYNELKGKLKEKYEQLSDMIGEDENALSIQVRFSPIIIFMKKAKIA